MAISDKQFHDLSEKVTDLFGSLKPVRWMIGVLVLIALPSAGYLIHLGERVSHLEGQRGDALGMVIQSIEKPTSPRDLPASLALLSAQARFDQQNGKKPPQENLLRASEAVKMASSAHPDLPEVWQAVSQLINLRSTYVTTAQDNSSMCISMPVNGEVLERSEMLNHLTLPAGASRITQGLFKNCTLLLDDVEGFSRSQAAALYKENVLHSAETLPFELSNVHVVYRGGTVIPVGPIVFRNCSFEMVLTMEPSPRGQLLAQQLLTAPSLADLKESPTAS